MGVNWRDVHSFGLPGSGVQKTCCWLFGLLSLSHMGLAGFWGVVEYICVCFCVCVLLWLFVHDVFYHLPYVSVF